MKTQPGDNQDNVLFISLISQFNTSALIGLGKVENPVTQKREKNLEQAKYSIDILTMLAEKTRGNLNTEEQQVLQKILTERRLDYLRETQGAVG